MLTQAVESYIGVRRAMGFAFRSEGSLLKSFAAFSDAAGKQYVNSDTAIEWAGSARSLPQRARRLGQVIRFARYIRAEDQHHEIPPAIFGCEKGPRPTPYIFSMDEIQRILQAASELGKRNAFRGHTYGTFFALLACTASRVRSDPSLFSGHHRRWFGHSLFKVPQKPSRSPSRDNPGCLETIHPKETHLYSIRRSRVRFLAAARDTSARCRNRLPRRSRKDRSSSRRWAPTSHDSLLEAHVCSKGAGDLPRWPRSYH